MGQGFESEFESLADSARKRWHTARAQTVQAARDDYERGRQIYADAIRTGRNVVARTPQEVRALGGAANAVVRSTGNTVSLGFADNADAATDALFGAGGPGNFRQRYQNELALQHEMDREAARDHPIATSAGDALGIAGALLTADEPAVAGVVARLFPNGAKAMKAIQGAKRIGFIPEGLGTMSTVGGGLVGGVTQLASDAIQGRRTTPQDLFGAVGGGMLGGRLAPVRGPVLSAALGGAATAALQGHDTDDIMRSATASAYGGRLLGTLGEQISNSLPRAAKGALGEGLTFAKSWARGEPIPPFEMRSSAVADSFPKLSEAYAGPQQTIPVGQGRNTIADWLTTHGRALESKFGNYASLTPNQKLAVPALGDLYLPDHWLPRDVGDFSGGWLGSALGPAAFADESQP